MAQVEEPRLTTLAERIAALNQQKNFQAPPSSVIAGKRAPPPPPPLRAATESVVSRVASTDKQSPTASASSPSIPPRPSRAATEKIGVPPLPRRTTDIANGASTAPAPAPPTRPLPPPLPSRNSQIATPPTLPSRRPSTQTLGTRRGSNASDVSHLSTISSLSLSSAKSNATTTQDVGGQPPRRLPPTLDQAKLPPLPPTRRELEAKAKEAAAQQRQAEAAPIPSLPPRPVAEPPRPSLPPRLPSRPLPQPSAEEPSPPLPSRRLPPPPTTSRPTPSDPGAPPPVPLASRPSAAQVTAVSSRSAQNSCLLCRDFSAPDAAAAQHPTSTLPRHDTIAYLAHVLCDPFPSATDKARAIFTWCHHNVAYDVHGFLNKCIPRGQTPAQSIFSGKAVCEGYARIYEAIALAAGLDCVVVTGHGKGYGYEPVGLDANGKPRSIPPKDPTGHAWNAVRIDGGRWKLIDACWGAGAIDNASYIKRFAAEFFTMSNDRFAIKHFPQDDRHWYRANGRPLSWEEYILGPMGGVELPRWSPDADVEGFDQFHVEPKLANIPVSHPDKDRVIRFQLSRVCEHWTIEKNGRGRPWLLALKTGNDKEFILLKGRSNDPCRWIDVPVRELGAPGQKVCLVGISKFNGRDARGLTEEEWMGRIGTAHSYSYAFLVQWDLV